MPTPYDDIVQSDSRGRVHLGRDVANTFYERRDLPGGIIQLLPATIHSTVDAPVLPDVLPFITDGAPRPVHDPDWNHSRDPLEIAKGGRLYLGQIDPGMGGQAKDFLWDLPRLAHGLIVGRPGSGISALLNLLATYSATGTANLEADIYDPKGTDFTWTDRYPSIHYAAPGGSRTLDDLLAELDTEMLDREAILTDLGLATLEPLLCAERRSLDDRYTLDAFRLRAEKTGEDIPRRRLVLLDLAGLVAGGEDYTSEHYRVLTKVGRLGRSLGVHLVLSVTESVLPKIPKDLLALLPLRIGMGHLSDSRRPQVLGSEAAPNLEEVRPGRGVVNAAGLIRVLQVAELPNAAATTMLDNLMYAGGLKLVERDGRQVWEDE